jgi:hypothetical protein
VKMMPDAVSVNAGRAQIEFRMDLVGVFLHAFFIMILGSISVGNSSGDFSYFLTKNCWQRTNSSRRILVWNRAWKAAGQ